MDMNPEDAKQPVVPATGAKSGQPAHHRPDTHRLLPQSPDAEKGVLCSLMLAPYEVAKFCETKGLTSAHFHIPAYGTMFGALMYLAGEGVLMGDGGDFIPLTEYLRNTGQLDGCGGAAAVTELFTFLPTAANAAYYVEIMQEKAELRELLSLCTETAARCYEEQDNLPALLGEHEERVAKIAGQRGSQATMERLQTLAFDVDKPPPDEPMIMSVAGVEVCHPGNITVIEAQQKAGKSAFVSAGLASVLTRSDGDFLGWRSDGNPKGLGVLHFDSEQSRGDHDKLIRRALARAGLAKPPAWFNSFCFTGWSVAEMRAAVSAAMADAVARFGGVHSVWLDGHGDLVQSPNDEQESFAYVRWLQSQAIAQACPVIGILHLNPGGTDKSRGHLGSELNRKAETVLRLTKDGDCTTVTTPHARHAPIPANDAPQFGWSDEHGRHVSVPTASTVKQQADEEEARRIIAAVWRDNPQAVRKYEDIIHEIMRYRGKSESDAKRKFGFSQQLNLVHKALGGIGYVLTE